MPEPQWSNACPPRRGDFRCDKWILPVPELTVEESKYHLLSSHSDNARGLRSSKRNDPIELPVLSPNSLAHPHYKVLISRRAHEELETVYMIRHDPVHYQRRYLVWFGIDLDGFGSIDTPEKFFQVLDLALASKKIIVQDNIPLEGPLVPKRILWMAMHGYFGNWYKPEERGWTILAANMHARILRKLWERGDLRLVNERVPKDTAIPSASSREIVTCLQLDSDCRRPMEKWLVFPEVLKEKYKLTVKEKEGQVHGCVNS
ncbi:hypothetical protein N7517_001615 [Penicillium concentricum]|uniref:Uncharacterized protein n=1 Tax=Penicillium concentricum TaxID=293559 RepID=A0A9W9SUC1_9EURO|nr:uncharacterized protein N7517_001615 [Penicillium concentricum]KAJ5383704.1 hypothetical protein N7517_001615 [Penicillium concentricum]